MRASRLCKSRRALDIEQFDVEVLYKVLFLKFLKNSCCNALAAVMRFAGFTVSILWTRFLAGIEIWGHGGDSMSYPASIELRT